MEQPAPDRLSATLESLVARFATMVRSVGARHGLAEADLDEVLQEVRIRIWRADPAGEQIGRVGASYVYRTAASAALDILRRRYAFAADRTDSVDDRADVLAHAAPGPHEQLLENEFSARILAAADTLALDRRAVVRMYLSGYDRGEIGELLGWSEARTRNLLYRGLADLRRRLTERGITMESIE